MNGIGGQVRRKHANSTERIVLLFLGFMLLGASLVLFSSCSCSKSQPSGASHSVESLDFSDVAEQEAAPEPEPEPAPEPYYILVAGSDTRDGGVDAGKGGHGSDGHARSDTTFLVRVDPANYGVALITVPRDTRTIVGGNVEKLNESYNHGGMPELVEQVEALTGVDIKYSFCMKLADFIPLVDTLGGVDANVPIPMKRRSYVTGDTVVLDPGWQHLDGLQTSILVQHRMQYGGDMDAARQVQTRAVVEWIIRRVAEMDADSAGGCASLLLSLCETDMPADEFVELVRSYAGHAGELKFLSGSGPYSGGIDPETELWLAYRDEDTWRAVIAAVEQGRDPNEIVPLPAVFAG